MTYNPEKMKDFRTKCLDFWAENKKKFQSNLIARMGLMLEIARVGSNKTRVTMVKVSKLSTPIISQFQLIGTKSI
jgi:hypothetical protein